MRKNRTKHEAKKPRLAKRALALCFALIFVCSCLLPAFANSEAGALTDPLTMVEEQDEQPTDPVLLNEGDTNPTGNDTNPTEEPKPAEQEPKADEPKNEEPKTEETKNEGTTESKDSAEQQGNEQTKPEQPKTEGTTESKDSTEEQPKPEGTTEEPKTEETKPEEPKQPTTNTTGDTIEQGKATYTYRFWPDKIDAFDLEAINDAVKKGGETLNDAAQSRVNMVPCTVLTVMTNANLRDYQANVQQPTKPGYEFAGWYTVDGTAEDDFSFDKSLNFEESKTIDVFAKWEKVESTVEDEMEKTEPTTEDELEKTESGKDSESKEETLPPVEKTGAVGLTNNEGDTVSIAVKAENLPGKVNKLAVTDLNDDEEEGAAFDSAFRTSSYTDWTATNLMVNITPKDIDGKTVQPSGAVRVTISDLSQLSIGTESIGEWKVLHLTKNNEIEALNAETTAVDSNGNKVLDSITFETTSFSPFVVVAKGKVADTLASNVNINVREVKTLNSGSTGGTWRVTSGWSSVVITTDKVTADNSGHPYAVDTDTSQRTTTVIEGIAPGNAVVKYYDRWGNLKSTFNIRVSSEVEIRTAEIYYMSSPNTDPASVEQGDWGPRGFGLAKVELPASAVWTTGSNNSTKIVLNPENYVTKWPDGTNGTSYLLDKSELFPGGDVTANSYRDGRYQVYSYGDGRNMERQAWYYIAENWLETLKTQYNVSNLTINDIQDITIVPKKLSKNNIGGQDTGTGFGNYDWHLDCGVSVEVNETYTVRFYIWNGNTWVLKSNATQIVLKNHTAFDPKTNPGAYDIDLKDANGGDLSGWSLERDNKGNIGDTETFPYNVNRNLDFFARYVPQDTVLDKDQPYIIVEKEVKGLTNVDQLPSDFCITIGGKSYDLNSNSRDGGIIPNADGSGFKIRWKIPVDAGNHTVGEDHYMVDGYKVEVKVNNEKVTNPFTSTNVNVTPKTFEVTPRIITKNSDNTFDFGVSNGKNHIFAISITGKGDNKKRNIIISEEPLSVSQRASVVKTLKGLTGEGSSFAHNDTNEFYSLKDREQIVVDKGIITYDAGNKQVTISNTSEWNKVVKLSYDVKTGSNPEVTITNTYTPATTSLTVTKTATKDGVKDTDTEFNFTLTLGSKSENVTWSKNGSTDTDTVTGTSHEFTLKGGESITFNGISVEDTNVKVTEDDYSAKHYTTTIKVNDQSVNDAAISAETLKLHQEAGTKVEFTNAYTTPKLPSMTIQKVVTGAFGERTKAFTFSVKLEPANSTLLNDVTVTGAASKDNLSHFTMMHGQKVTLENIPIDTTITITESDAKDYKTKATNYEVNPDKKFIYEVVADENGNAVLKSKDNNQTVAHNAIIVTNDFDGTPDTGVLLDTLPYLILLAVAVAGGVLVVVRKRKHRDE